MGIPCVLSVDNTYDQLVSLDLCLKLTSGLIKFLGMSTNLDDIPLLKTCGDTHEKIKKVTYDIASHMCLNEKQTENFFDFILENPPIILIKKYYDSYYYDHSGKYEHDRSEKIDYNILKRIPREFRITLSAGIIMELLSSPDGRQFMNL